LDDKSRSLDVDNDTSLRAFTEEVFNTPHDFPRLPATVESAVKDRLVRAELAFAHGRGAGVQEEDISRFVNSIAAQLGAPGYARTSAKQVRVLRMNLIVAAPTFMGKGSVRAEMKVGESVNSTMSPL